MSKCNHRRGTEEKWVTYKRPSVTFSRSTVSTSPPPPLPPPSPRWLHVLQARWTCAGCLQVPAVTVLTTRPAQGRSPSSASTTTRAASAAEPSPTRAAPTTTPTSPPRPPARPAAREKVGQKRLTLVNDIRPPTTALITPQVSKTCQLTDIFFFFLSSVGAQMSVGLYQTTQIIPGIPLQTPTLLNNYDSTNKAQIV